MKHLFYTIYLVLVSFSVAFSQSNTESIDINDYIAKRKALYLTGTSSNVSKKYREEYYSSVRMIVNYRGDIEIRPLPLKTVGAFIPERINENGFIIGKLGSSGKQNDNDYYSENPSGRELIISFDQALADKEIDKELLDPKYLNTLAKSLALVKQTNPTSTITPRCLITALSQTYFWMDEFDKMDFIQSKAGELATIYYKQDLRNASTATNKPELYADFLVNFGEYDFNNQSYPVTVKKIIGISANMLQLPFVQSIEIDEHSIRISPAEILKNLDDEEQYSTKMGNTEIKMSSDIARVLAKSFTGERTLILRLALAPEAVSNSAISCENILNASIYYACKSVKIYDAQMIKQVEGVFYLSEWW